MTLGTSAPKVLVVEDAAPQRENLHEALERRGFDVRSAGNVATARQHIKEWRDTIDVALLDMRLEDPDAPGVFGTTLGAEIRQHQAKNPAELLILTAYPDIDFMETALRLGAAAYLPKPMEIQEVVRLIRVLTLRRWISEDSAEKSRKIRRLVEISHSQLNALICYSRRMLAPLLEKTLGLTVQLLFSDSKGTHSCGGPFHGFTTDPRGFFHSVASLAFRSANTSKSFVVDRHRFPKPQDAMEEELLARLDGASVVSLAESGAFRLSAVLLPKATYPAEDPERLAPILAHYVHSSVASQLLGVATLGEELAAQRRALLVAASNFCLAVGRQQIQLLESAEIFSREKDDALRRLHAFGEDLADAGQILADLYDDSQEASWKEATDEIEVVALIRQAWNHLAETTKLPQDALRFENEGRECYVVADRGALAIAFNRLLRWLAKRFSKSTTSKAPITIACSQDDEGTRILFRDSSRRLPAHLREYLLLPFSEAAPTRPDESDERENARLSFLSLYLVRAMLESKSHGYLIDRTEDLKSEIGHCFEIGLPHILPRSSKTGSVTDNADSKCNGD